MRVGMIGLGAIGAEVLAAARAGRLGPGQELVAVLVRRPRAEEPLATTDRDVFLARLYPQNVNIAAADRKSVV